MLSPTTPLMATEMPAASILSLSSLSASGALAGLRPVGVEPEKATRVVGELLGGLGGERLAPVGPDVGDGGEALVGEVSPHPLLPVEHGVHRVEEPWARLFCRDVADGPEVGDLEAVVRPLSCEEIPYAHVDLACEVPQLPHRRLPRAIEPLGELWEGLRDLPVREAAAANRPFEHLGVQGRHRGLPSGGRAVRTRANTRTGTDIVSCHVGLS